jgi:hypothetical protein
MVTLGAHFGFQATGAVDALRLLNPMPYKVVAVDARPENCEWCHKHFADNGISPDESWVVQMAMSATNDPVFFPIGASGRGSNSASRADEIHARRDYFKRFVAEGQTEQALERLLLSNTTGLTRNLVEGKDTLAEIKLVSAATLNDIIGGFDRVDFLEADIQYSEKYVFPPAMDLLNRKVRRIHLGTHGQEVHALLLGLFIEHGWEIVFDFPGESSFDTSFGKVVTNDGILSVANPRLAHD